MTDTTDTPTEPHGRNTELFDRVALAIQQAPERYDQQTWCNFPEVAALTELWSLQVEEPQGLPDLSVEDVDLECGSVMCIAGWAAWLEGARPITMLAGHTDVLDIVDETGEAPVMWKLPESHPTYSPVTYQVDIIAQNLLGLTQLEACDLFDAYYRPCQDDDSGVLAERVALALRCIGRGMAVADTHDGEVGDLVRFLDAHGADYE